ncbi:Protein FAM71A [Manis javanica]|nr:Protein FAM71A [Manis javanica]
MLVAQPVRDCEKHTGCGQATEGKEHRDTKELELTRLLPWKLVNISVHSRERQQLRVKLASGRSYYLQLWAPPDKQEDLFAYWEEVIDLLRPPVEAYSSTYAVPAGDLFISVFEEMDRRSPEAAHFQGSLSYGKCRGETIAEEISEAMKRSPRVGMFNTAMGQLQRQLQPKIRSRIGSLWHNIKARITKQGELTDVHNCTSIMTVGIANTNPFDPIPHVMLLAQLVPGQEKHAGFGQATEGKGHKATKTLELTGLFPLKLVKISVHNRDKQQLRLKLATGPFLLQVPAAACPSRQAGRPLWLL